MFSFSLRYFLFVIVGGAQLLGGCASTTWNSAAPEVTVDTGQLRGAVIDAVRSFKGIPFAAPPLGELRWVPPQPAADWTGVRSATEYAPHCAQIDPGILWFELDEYSEDCLALNVWSPAAPILMTRAWSHASTIETFRFC